GTSRTTAPTPISRSISRRKIMWPVVIRSLSGGSTRFSGAWPSSRPSGPTLASARGWRCRSYPRRSFEFRFRIVTGIGGVARRRSSLLDRVPAEDEVVELELASRRIGIGRAVVGDAAADISDVHERAGRAGEVVRASDLERRAAEQHAVLVVLEPAQR